MLGYIKPGMTEKQVRNELENFMFANGADSLAFGSIVASGPNTANPHAVPSDRVIEKATSFSWIMARVIATTAPT